MAILAVLATARTSKNGWSFLRRKINHKWRFPATISTFLLKESITHIFSQRRTDADEEEMELFDLKEYIFTP
jgi:hypothetical protein